MSELFPQLFHYTDANGPRGILENNELWATHHRYLNDTNEITESRSRLLPRAIEAARGKFQWWKDDPDLSAHLERLGGYQAVVDHETTNMVDAMFRTTAKLAPQYIVSFSTHIDADELQNGALDLWRAYSQSGTGGYALVFDTHSLETLMAEEGRKHASYMMHLQDVCYLDQADDDVSQLAIKLVDVLNGIIQKLGLPVHGDVLDPTDVYALSMLEMSRHKNWHFRNEREVRLVTSPQTKGTSPSTKNITGRKVFHRLSGECFIPTAQIFGTDVSSLPITKIIVGPGDRQEQRAAGLKSFVDSLDRDISVVSSRVPFRLQ